MGTLKAVNLGLVSGTLNTELDGQDWDEYILHRDYTRHHYCLLGV